MAGSDFDILVVGAGSGGVRAARMAAGHGARVAVIEAGALGGVCVNLGCIPKKLFVQAAHFSADVQDMAGFGWRNARAEFDWPRLRDNKNREIARLNLVYQGLLERAGVRIIRGTAEFVTATSMRVGTKHITADKILLATGSHPVRPDIPGSHLAIVSDDAFHLERFPGHALVVGGGYIAVEFAGIFRGLGAEVDLVHRGASILRGFDDSVRAFITAELRKKGIRVHCGAQVVALAAKGTDATDRIVATLADGRELSADLALYAIGRRPNIQGLNLAAAGVAVTTSGAVLVDQYFCSNVPEIFAIGDLIGKVQLTPVAIAEGMAVARTMALNELTTVDYAAIPTAVFCQPNIGTVGLTEAQARAQGMAIAVYESTFRPLRHTLSGASELSYIKLVVNQDNDLVLGAHMVGPEAGEIIQGLAVAMKAGATKAVFDTTIGVHPTAAEEFVTMRAKSPAKKGVSHEE